MLFASRIILSESLDLSMKICLDLRPMLNVLLILIKKSRQVGLLRRTLIMWMN